MTSIDCTLTSTTNPANYNILWIAFGLNSSSYHRLSPGPNAINSQGSLIPTFDVSYALVHLLALSKHFLVFVAF